MFPQKVCEEVATLCRQETAGRQCASARHHVTTRYGTENSLSGHVSGRPTRGQLLGEGEVHDREEDGQGGGADDAAPQV